MDAIKVYLSEHIHPSAMQKLQTRAEIIANFDHPEELDAAIIRVAKMPRSVIEKVKKMKVIAKHGIGYDNIDVAAAKELGIRVVYTPTANVNSVAELIVSLILACKRCIARADAMIRQNACTKVAPKELTGQELAGSAIGLVGLGKIAQTAGRILRDGFGCRLIGYDPFISAEQAERLGIKKYDSLEQMLAEADCVNISVPLTDSTRNLIGAAQLACMKPTAVLVNAARGGIVNEKALYDALSARQIFAAACDVFEVEPPSADNPLTTLDNFIATPHVGASTDEALYRMGMGVVDDIFRIMDGQEPQYPVF